MDCLVQAREGDCGWFDLNLLRRGASLPLLTSLAVHVRQVQLCLGGMPSEEGFSDDLLLLTDVNESFCLLLRHEVADQLCRSGREIVLKLLLFAFFLWLGACQFCLYFDCILSKLLFLHYAFDCLLILLILVLGLC